MELKGLCSLNIFVLESITALDTEFAQLDCLKCSRMNQKMLGPLGSALIFSFAASSWHFSWQSEPPWPSSGYVQPPLSTTLWQSLNLVQRMTLISCMIQFFVTGLHLSSQSSRR